MSKQHTGALIDRYIIRGRAIIRAQLRNGTIIDVKVPDALRDKAASIWGRGTVRFEYRGGRAVFVGDLNDYPEMI